MNKWGFIYATGEASGERQHDVIGASACQLVCVGIPSAEELPAAARLLLDEGVELIELCGAFGGPGLTAVLDEVDGQVPVGAVFYGGEAASGLQNLFG